MASGWDKVRMANMFGRGKKKMPPPAKTAEEQPPLLDSVSLHLGDTSLLFQNGKWLLDKSGDTESMVDVRNENEALRQENNLLKFKIQVLTDMLTLAHLDAKNAMAELKEREDEES
eukprot:GCRY01003385.1.p1 GENE.GCRY01003385.1~~GCRY01003385.1.p1  ORF type:complete len:116 (-),score=18.25 GCRY01003385.1:344-691(-)